MTRFARSERQGLGDTFERVGPDAPTLCSPWRARDLAAHLVVRERRVRAETDLGAVTITGTPGELLLYSFGRKDAAQVDLSGSEESLTALKSEKPQT